MRAQRYFLCAAISAGLHSLAFTADSPNAPLSASLSPTKESVNIQLMSTPAARKTPLTEAIRNTKSIDKTATVTTKAIVQKQPITTTSTTALMKKTTPTPITPKQQKPTIAMTTPKPPPQIPAKNTEKPTTSRETLRDSMASKAQQHAPVQLEKPLFAVRPVAPTYPRIAKRKGMEGVVLIEVWLDEKGNQIKQILIKSAGFALLDNAAITAIKKWHFSGYKQNGVPVAHRVRIPVRFNLD